MILHYCGASYMHTTAYRLFQRSITLSCKNDTPFYILEYDNYTSIGEEDLYSSILPFMSMGPTFKVNGVSINIILERVKKHD